MAKKKTSLTTLMDCIRHSASRLKDGKLQKLNLVSSSLNGIKTELGFESDFEAIVFVAIFDRQCGCLKTDLEDLSDYFEISTLEGMQFVPALNSLIAQGYLTAENRSETLLTRKRFVVCPDVFYAIIENRKVEPVTMTQVVEFDQFDFCLAVNKLIRERKDESIETRKLFICVQKLEDEHNDLELISQLRSIINDVEARTLFYEMGLAFSECPEGNVETDIVRSLEDIYERVLDRAKVNNTILESKHPLIQADLICQSDESSLKLTNKGIRLLFGSHADALIKTKKVEDRYEFVKKVYELVDNMRRHPSGLEQRVMYSELHQLEEDNTSLSIVVNVKNHLDDIKSRLIYYLIADELVDGSTFSLSNLSNFCSRSQEIKVKQRIKEGDHPLIRRELVQVSGGGMFDGAQLSFTDKGKELFLEEDLHLFEVKVDSKDLLQPEKIAQKQLFFDAHLQGQLTMLSNSLCEDNYVNLCQRLEQNNLPKGVSVLLYGNPGTGKTESVMQIAKATGRPIMHVDISATKTCWFGESEKLIKEVFTKYRKLCQKSPIKPILLFNEADAVFSKRKDSNSSSVAQTENAIQNIILEEMENLDGILVATTNLADNLDKAFERRFLFKIRFERPTVEARISIWKDKLKSLTEEEVRQLATKYDLSGGEIDNITRKVIMTEVLEGKRPTLEQIMEFCNQEKIINKTTKVGF